MHLLFRGAPNTDISKFINTYKSASSRLIKKEFPHIRKQLWEEYFWSRSYCLALANAQMNLDKAYKNFFRYYISILVHTENIQLSKTDKKIGVDLGICNNK